PVCRNKGGSGGAVLLRGVESAAAPRRLDARLRSRPGRLGQGRGQEHGRRPNGRAAPVPRHGRCALRRPVPELPGRSGPPALPRRVLDPACRARGISGRRARESPRKVRRALAAAVAVALLLACRTSAGRPESPGLFRDITRASGIDFHISSDMQRLKMIPTMIGGCAFGDYDGDGLPDLYVTNSVAHWGKPNEKSCGRLYHNLGGGRFEDVT